MGHFVSVHEVRAVDEPGEEQAPPPAPNLVTTCVPKPSHTVRSGPSGVVRAGRPDRPESWCFFGGVEGRRLRFFGPILSRLSNARRRSPPCPRLRATAIVTGPTCRVRREGAAHGRAFAHRTTGRDDHRVLGLADGLRRRQAEPRRPAGVRPRDSRRACQDHRDAPQVTIPAAACPGERRRLLGGRARSVLAHAPGRAPEGRRAGLPAGDRPDDGRPVLRRLGRTGGT